MAWRDPERDLRARLMLLFFSAGAMALTTQVILLRELMVALLGDEISLGLGLGAWLAGIATGAMAGRPLARRRPVLAAGAGFAGLAAAGAIEVIVARLGRSVVQAPPGEILSVGPSLLLALAVLFLPGACVGFSFSSMAGVAARAGFAAREGIARLYVLEAAGSLAGGLGATFLLIPFFPPFHAIVLAGAICLLAAIPAARAGLVSGRFAYPILALVLILLGLPPISARIEADTVRARFAALAPEVPLLAWTDTPYQHVAVGGGAIRHVYAGGQYAGSFPDPEQSEVLAHELACFCPHPRRVLAVGRVSYGALRFLLRHPVEQVDLVEIDRRACELVWRFLAPEDAKALADPRVRIVYDDPRRFLAASVDRYDLIVILEPDPVTLLLARFSTAEFFRLAARSLSPDGAFVVRVATAPNVLSGETAAMAGSIWRALREAFPAVRATPGPEGLLLAGWNRETVTLDPAVLARRFRERNIVSKAFVLEMFALEFPPERVESQESQLDLAMIRVPASRDDKPVSFLHAATLRQQVAGSSLAPILAWTGKASWLLLGSLAVLPSLLVLLTLARRRAWGRPTRDLAALHVVAITGASGMVWSLVVLFFYQSRVGALYGRIGWLAATFMLGLAIGGFVASRAGEPGRNLVLRPLALAGQLALLFAASVPPTLLGMTALPARLGLVAAASSGVLLLLAGAVTGSVFPIGAAVLLAGRAHAAEAGGRIEAADHAGAAVAAVVAAVVLIPALGLFGVTWLLVVLQGCAVAGVLLAHDSE